jgi:hypothetical protein
MNGNVVAVCIGGRIFVGVGFIRPEVVSSGRWDIREEVAPP